MERNEKMNTAVVGISVIGVLIIIAVIMIVSGILVSADAKKRGMNPVAWGLIAAFAPVLIGVIVYLVSRQPVVEFVCSKCGEPVIKGENVCPKCNSVFIGKCENCGYVLNPSWKICPNCGEGVKEDGARLVKEYKKSNSIIMVIVLVLIIAVSLIFIGVRVPKSLFGDSYSYYGSNASGSIGMGNITKEELSVNKDIGAWIKECDSSSKEVFVLISKTEGIGIVYLKEVKTLCKLSVDLEYNVDGEFNIYLTAVDSGVENKYGFDFYVFEADMNYDINIEANLPNSSVADVEITYTEASIGVDTWKK